jgi:hypothetical protein
VYDWYTVTVIRVPVTVSHGLLVSLIRSRLTTVYILSPNNPTYLVLIDWQIVGGMAGLIEGQNRAVMLFAIIPFQKKNCNTFRYDWGGDLNVKWIPH